MLGSAMADAASCWPSAAACALMEAGLATWAQREMAMDVLHQNSFRAMRNSFVKLAKSV